MFNIGSVVLINGIKYRILQAQGTELLLIGLEMDKYSFFRIDAKALKAIPGIQEVEDPYTPNTTIEDDELAMITEKQEAIREIITGLGSNIDFLQGNRTCTGVKEYMEKFKITKRIVHRDIRRYLQSGQDMYSLRDRRKARATKNEGIFSGNHKGGHAFCNGSIRIPIDPKQEEKYFEEGFRMIDTGKSLSYIVDTLNRKYFSEVILDEEGNFINILPAPINECLSEKRFRRYCFEKMKGISLSKYRKGVRKRMNDDRIKYGTAQSGCTHPGAILEVDACELDIIIVGKDRRQDLGRPVVYFSIDVFSCMIVGWYVGFENNSFLGATSLFANMFFSGERILPDAIRVDHGSEWVSKAIERIGKELGIRVQIVAPAAGSFKGLVENSFHVYQKNLRNAGREYGAIYKEYESKHYDKASAMVSEIRQDIESFVSSFNRTLRKNYELSKHMVECGIRAVPEELWRYGIQYMAAPRQVVDAIATNVLFSLCEPVAAKKMSLSRNGITIKGLCYISEDPRMIMLIRHEYYDTEPVDYEVRRDPRTVDYIWVRTDGETFQVPLGELHDNLQSYKGLTWHEYEMIYNDMKANRNEYLPENRRQRLLRQETTERILKKGKREQAAISVKNNKTGIRDARMEAQQDERRASVLGAGIAGMLTEPEQPAALPGPSDTAGDTFYHERKRMRLEDMYD